MKILFSLILIPISLFSFSQEPDFKTLKKSIVKLNDSLYISKYEASNADWRAFRVYVKTTSDAALLESTLVDTLLWRSKSAYNEPYVKHYYQHPAYQIYPVVAISYPAVIDYCKWLTDQYNINKKRKFEKVNFRLPTKSEWKTAVQAGNKDAIYPWEGNSVFNEKGLCRANFRRSKEETEKMKKMGPNALIADVLAPVTSYWPNTLGIYNLSGNAAEMLLKKGTTAGGSWRNTSDYLSIHSEDPFKNSSTPNTSIGFRWVMEVIEE